MPRCFEVCCLRCRCNELPGKTDTDLKTPLSDYRRKLYGPLATGVSAAVTPVRSPSGTDTGSENV